MSCRLIKNNNNQITGATAPNGKRSILFDKLVEATGDTNKAEALYNEVASDMFKAWFGINWETDANSADSLVTDENGEPKLIPEVGMYVIYNTKGIPTEILAEDRERTNALPIDREVQEDLINTIVGVINKTRAEHPGIFQEAEQVNRFFNIDKDTKEKGILADKILLEAFNGLEHNNEEDVKTAKSLYKTLITEGKEAFNNALPEGVTLNNVPGSSVNAAKVFILAYDKWNSTYDSAGNVISVGVRELVTESLANYGMKLSDDTGIVEEFEEDFVRIYSQSRLSEDPQKKLSSEAKYILSNIITGTNSLGYAKTMPISQAYGLMTQSVVGEPDWGQMLSKLQYYSEFNDEVLSILNTIKSLSAKDQATIFSNFSQAYKNFILFKSVKAEDAKGNEFFTNQIINSNQNHLSKKAKAKFRQNSREKSVLNPRAIYKIKEDGTLSVKPDKLKTLQKSWSVIDGLSQARTVDVLEDYHIDALGEYLWTLGVQYGATLEQTQSNLKKYFRIGSEELNANDERISGMTLFKNLVFNPQKPFKNFLNAVEKETPQDLYRVHSTTIDKLADLAVLFDTKPFGAFINGTGKQYYPINLLNSLDELAALISNPKNGSKLNEFFESLQNDPLNMPAGSIKYYSPLIHALSRSPEAQSRFEIKLLDSYKAANEIIATTDYDNQSPKISLIERFIAYQNRGSKDYTLATIPNQADRPQLAFVEIMRVAKMMSITGATRTSILEGFILQDLARINQATQQVLEAQEANDPSSLFEGYHYKKGSSPYAKDGPVFTETQIMGLGEKERAGELNIDNMSMAAFVNDFITGEMQQGDPELDLFKNYLSREVNELETRIKGYETLMSESIDAYGINLEEEVNADLNTAEKQSKFIQDFVFEAFVQKIELTKLLRGGFSSTKNVTDYYKRMGLIGTPGTKLFIKGMSKENPDYGMAKTYRAATIRDYDFVEKEEANKIADTMRDNLIESGVTEADAIKIANNYRSLNKSDAQSIISLTMYKNIMEGMGQWSEKDDEAYKNHQDISIFNPNATKFVDNQGNPRPIYPIKPYHEELTNRNGANVMSMDKNSYTILTYELAEKFPALEGLLVQMYENNIDVINTESANKGVRKPNDFANTGVIDPNTILTMDSTKLRLPQITPKTKRNDITFNVQLRKNIIANVFNEENYKLGDTTVSGAELTQVYGESIAEKIDRDTKKMEKELGIPNLEKETPGTVEYGKAKKKYLQNVRDKISKAVKDKDLPNNYLEALTIVPNGPFNWKFKVPLAFPNYQGKFEGMVLSMYRNAIFIQKLKGLETVQIAELGGHEETGELKMYNGSNTAEVRIKRSALGYSPDTTIEEIKDSDSNIMIGYRIPQQGKNSALVMKVVGFLPESHEKAIMVPGGITVQMGSDFDIDKLYLFLPELNREGKYLKPNYKGGVSKMTDKMLNNVIFDVFKSILTDPKHLKEVVNPLDIQNLRDARKVLGALEDTKIDYNDPLAEIQMEERNKASIAGRGLWSNAMAGRNVAERSKNMKIKEGYAPIIDDVVFNLIGTTEDIYGNYTDSNISEYLSAAVDAANEPIQIDIHDNVYTIPVASLMLSVGIPIDTVIYFLAQPAIVEAFRHAKINNVPMSKLEKSIKYAITKIAGANNFVLSGQVTSMSRTELLENLREPNDTTQLNMLDNFYQFYLAGRALQTVYKIITPDTTQNVTELAAISAKEDIEDLYLRNTDSLIKGAEELITHHMTKKLTLNPIGAAYRGIMDTMVKETDRLGFINNTPAFRNFKLSLRDNLDQTGFNTKQHKTIDRALFSYIMSRPHSPLVEQRGELAGLISKEAIKNLYINPENNIITILERLKLKYPRLNNNEFIKLLEKDLGDEENKIYTLNLDVPFGASTADKNILSNSLLDIIKNPQNYANTGDDVAEIRNFGKILVANQLLNSGFSPTFGGYIDLIPSEVFTTDILNPGKQTPVQFFEQEMQELQRADYFNDFIHEFVRSYGMLRPGKKSFLRVVNRINPTNALGQVTFGKKDDDIWNEQEQRYVNYFLTFSKNRGPQVFVNTGANQYTRLNLKGNKGKLTEVGIYTNTGRSLINTEMDSTIEPPLQLRITEYTEPVDNIDDNERPLKIC